MRGATQGTSRKVAWALGCVLVAVAVYLPSLAASFQFDDWGVIVADARVSSLAAWFSSMPGIRPLLKFTYALNNELGGSPAGFRSLNIAVHALNTLLVYGLLYTLGSQQHRDPTLVRTAALTATLIFALHPVQTEAVTYISGRSTSLAATFALSSLLVWAQTVEATQPMPGRLLSLALFALGLAVKETVLVLPLALLLWRAVTGPQGAAAQRAPLVLRRRATVVAQIGPHAALAGAALLIAATWQPYQRLLATSWQLRGIGSNLLTQADAIIWLVGQLLCLAPVNPDPALNVASTSSVSSWSHAALVAAAIIAGVWLLRRRPALAFGVLWFLLWLLPTNSVLPRLDVVNDRQLYLALIGPAWLAGLALARAAQGSKRAAARHPGVVLGLALTALIGALTGLTMRQNRLYADEVTFWQAVAQRSPQSARAADNLGFAYAMACRQSDAAREFERALRLDPRNVRARVNARLLQEGALSATSGPRDCAQSTPN